MMEQGVVPVYSCTSQFAKGNLILTLFLPHTLRLLLYKKKKTFKSLQGSLAGTTWSGCPYLHNPVFTLPSKLALH